jgi:aminoglycoside 3-N-acetyltransferase
MIGYRDLDKGFAELGLTPRTPVIIHVAHDSFETVRGGMEALIGALIVHSYSIVTPAFTYRTMLIPEKGPESNGVTYGSGREMNEIAEAFTLDMPPDETLGDFPVIFSHLPGVTRSRHPILSFYGLHAEEYLEPQSLLDPLAVIQTLMANEGIVVMVNVEQTANTSIHLGERMANRKSFIRWALSANSMVECPNFPGCSSGFNAINSAIDPFCGKLQLAGLDIKAFPLRELISTTRNLIQADPNALLCQRTDCERCNVTRMSS